MGDAERLAARNMKPGDLVAHTQIPEIGYGLVMQLLGAHSMVLWAYDEAIPWHTGEPTLEVNSFLEIVNESG